MRTPSTHRLALLAFVAALAASCGMAPKKSHGGSAPSSGSPLDGDGKKGGTPEEVNARQVSLASFKETLYPVLRANCATCHAGQVAPYFAATDAEASHDAVVDGHKVDFTDAGKSRLVQRMAPERHNCFADSCEAAATVMADAIKAWDEKIKAAGAKRDDGLDGPTTEAMAFAAAKDVDATGPQAMVVPAARFTNVVAPFALRNDDADGAVTSYVVATTPANVVVQGNQNGATATATFNVTAAGTYYLWARVKTPNANAKAFNVSVDNGPFATLTAPVTQNAWAWAAYANGAMPVALNLTAGNHTVTLKQREQLARLNQLALSPMSAGFNGSANGGKVKVLTYDLKPLIGKNATLSVEVREFDAKTKTILLRNMRLTTDAAVTVKDVMPLINGQWNPIHATYRIVDATVNPPGAVLSESALVMVGDNGFGGDALSFTFGEIK